VEPGSIWWFILVAVLLGVNAVLALARAVFRSRRVKALGGLEENGSKVMALVLKDLDKPLIAILIVRVALQVVTTLMMGAYAFVLMWVAESVAMLWIVMPVYALLVMILCELLPRAIAKRSPERIARGLAPFVVFLMFVLYPVVYLLGGVDALFRRVFDVPKDEDASAVTEEELMTIVNASNEDGVLKDEERDMIHNVFAFGEARAKDVMTPRMDMVALSEGATAEEAMEVFRREQFSRVPVYREDLDHVVGILHFKDLVFAQGQTAFCLSELMREPLFTYESKLTSELFTQMRSMSSPLAVVLDEYGGTAGIVTLEDMVEEIVGEILDEYDEEEEVVELVQNTEYVTEGAVKIEDFNEMAGTKLTSEDYDSIGGYVIGLLGDIPSQDEVVTDEENRITFTVIALDKNRIERLHVRLHPEEESLDK